MWSTRCALESNRCSRYPWLASRLASASESPDIGLDLGDLRPSIDSDLRSVGAGAGAAVAGLSSDPRALSGSASMSSYIGSTMAPPNIDLGLAGVRTAVA